MLDFVFVSEDINYSINIAIPLSSTDKPHLFLILTFDIYDFSGVLLQL